MCTVRSYYLLLIEIFTINIDNIPLMKLFTFNKIINGLKNLLSVKDLSLTCEKTIKSYLIVNYTLFYKQRFFSTQPQCCLTFSWIELQVLLRCCLIHRSIIILRDFLYFIYLFSCLDLGLSISYLCHLFLFSSSFSLWLII